ncbi:MAG: 1-phosphofructokinase family hexose kinase [Bacteroidales bacterium]
MKIVTLTMNPALDKSTSIETLQAKKKLRCSVPRYEPGGGGINVSRAIKILGGESLSVFAAGGFAGEQIKDLLKEEEVEFKCIKTKNPSRENLVVLEKSTDNQYRFGMPGKEVDDAEQNECLDYIKQLPDSFEFLIASGSLPPGVPDDFYGKVAKIANKKNLKCIVDTSGEALTSAAKSGVCMLKPNLRELSLLTKKDEINGLEQEEIAQEIIRKGSASVLVVSLGARGAMLVTKDKIKYVIPPTVKQKSTVGAGDSMVAGIVLSMARGDDLFEAVKWGVAAGTAATMTPGTELCRKKDVEKIYEWISKR